MELSILIPARNEIWLAKTIQDILEHSESDTEILVGLDGAWSDPVIEDHPRVTILHTGESIGQRAMTNRLAALSKATYIMKVDAHCSFDQGFDRKMLEAFKETGDDVTMVPNMKNLHVFDWVCEDGHRRYQSPSGSCKDCGKDTTRDVVWYAKKSPNSTSYCFDSQPHFQYWNAYKGKQEGDIVETMSLQGSSYMMTRENYLKLAPVRESFGSWGNEGLEIACYTWLSGKRVLCNKRTWYAHMFRTQGGDFSFPYQNPESEISKTKDKVWNCIKNKEMPDQLHPVVWLLDKFWPVPGWTEEQREELRHGRSHNQ